MTVCRRCHREMEPDRSGLCKKCWFQLFAQSGILEELQIDRRARKGERVCIERECVRVAREGTDRCGICGDRHQNELNWKRKLARRDAA